MSNRTVAVGPPPAILRTAVQLADRVARDHQLVPAQERAIALGQRSAGSGEARDKDAYFDDDRSAVTRSCHSVPARRKDSALSWARSTSSMDCSC
jgi:hypothetical protein